MSILDNLFIKLINLYQVFISVWIAPSCKFSPTCSYYAVECIKKHGTTKSIKYIIKRILSCNPLNKKSGYDPIP
tara:strand:- start:512 stop:733 length:222 start_codon:yes stop_codon:yes gene_type:complete